jgi:hypothetical protein
MKDDDRGELARLLYLDDSGSALHGGLVVYGWVEVHPSDWTTVLGRWLDLRRSLARDYGIPQSQELHATDFVRGRGRIARRPPTRFIGRNDLGEQVVLWKDLGREVAERCLIALRDAAELRVGAVYRWEPATTKAWGRAKYATYGDLIRELDAELRRSGHFAVVAMDGSDPHYRAVHRALPLTHRRIIEDPMMHDSRESHWTQMADLVAYTANITLNRHHGTAFGWDWYADFLAPRDPFGAPRELPPQTAGPA